MLRDGMVIHLYAGEETGFTMMRAWKQAGACEAHLIEVDLKRGDRHDMLKDEGVYSAILTAALQGKVRAVIGGPNCRTRSVLRHYPIEGVEAPRPVRAWGGEEYGKADLTPEEEKIVKEDDVLLWRMIFAYMVAEYSRRARGLKDPVQMALEQPASPCEYMPSTVSFWNTVEWAIRLA